MLKGVKAVIFDLDGVIIDSERTKFRRLGLLLKKRGLRLSKRDFAGFVGMKTSAFLSAKFKGRLSTREIAAIAEERRKDQMRHLRLYAKPIPGAQQFIRLLKNRKVQLCLATGTQRPLVKRVLHLLGLEQAFRILVTGEEFASSKPEPEVYHLAVKKLRLPKTHILVTEDSAAGVSAAKKAGLYCAAITTTQSAHELRAADVQVRSFAELRNMFMSQSGSTASLR